MEIKLFEVRDRMTFIPVMAVRYENKNEWLMRRAGFADCTIVTRLTDLEAQHDPYGWRGGTRTMPEAHKHIIKNWYTIKTNDVIDVEYILGETSFRKLSEGNPDYGRQAIGVLAEQDAAEEQGK